MVDLKKLNLVLRKPSKKEVNAVLSIVELLRPWMEDMREDHVEGYDEIVDLINGVKDWCRRVV